jgi:ribonuclease VapC
MIVDSSAIMALLLHEPERPAMTECLARSIRNQISAGSWIELGAVLTRRRNAVLFDALDQVIESLLIIVAPVSVEQALIGHAAYREYGIGTGHPASLNFGDCFAYALAKATGEPLLFKGDDFSKTDVTPALKPPPPPADAAPTDRSPIGNTSGSR